MQVTPDERAALELTGTFKTHAELPKLDEAGSGIGGSPRQSYYGTAVVLSPEDYHALLAVRAIALRMIRGDDGEAVTEEWLRSVGFKEGRFKQDLVLSPILRGINIAQGLAYWCVRTYQIPDESKPTTRGQLRALAESLGINLEASTPPLAGRSE